MEDEGKQFFFKKRTKKLLILEVSVACNAHHNEQKVFASLRGNLNVDWYKKQKTFENWCTPNTQCVRQ